MKRGRERIKKNGGSRSVTLDGNPLKLECGGALLSTPSRVQYHRRSQAARFRVRKGTGRLTWAMTTAKPM